MICVFAQTTNSTQNFIVKKIEHSLQNFKYFYFHVKHIFGKVKDKWICLNLILYTS